MADEYDGEQPPVTSTASRELTELGEKIFLDRYALKDVTKTTLAAGDLAVVCTDTGTGQREAGTVRTVTDAFMEMVHADDEWQLAFPDIDDPDYEELWDGDLDAWKARGKRTIVHRKVRARQVWPTLTESAWASAEPGVWFKDHANAMSNSHYYAPLICTNPCGKQPLPEWPVCNLGAINLGR